MPTALEMNREDWRRYKPTRSSANQSQIGAIRELRAKALEVAKQAAGILRDRFGARKVVIFGSLASKEGFTLWSDIDLAAWGIATDDFYLAVAAVTGLSPDFRIDLVDPDDCRDSIRDAIQGNGMEI